MYILWMSETNRDSHKDNERTNANTGFVQNEHCSITPTTGDQGPSNTCGPSKLVGRVCQQA
eukprot:10299981-Prorocentrum_lima.AAC.1